MVQSGSPAHATRPLRTGLVDGVFSDSTPSLRAQWFQRARSVNAGFIRVPLPWRSIAPERPALDPADPGDPRYRWSATDATVRDASAKGFRILLTVSLAPDWAQGRGAPVSAPVGTWRPEPARLAEFLRAAARRYSGSFRDGAAGAVLPRVRYWQIWNEPNLFVHLTPQEVRGGGKTRLVSPRHYRRMLNASYRALKVVRRDTIVVTAGLSPYGDRTGRRTAPVRFLRELLCLRGRRLTRTSCPAPAHFDALAHHPYSVGGPRRKALAADDVSVPDLHKLNRVVSVAVRSGRALPRRRKPLWVTEISWDSGPPDPDGVPLRRHASWLAESIYLTWKQKAEVIIWQLIRDDVEGASFYFTYQSGLFFRNGQPKPAARAFSFPFHSLRADRSRVLVWAKAPRRGRVSIERRRGGTWRRVARLRAGRSGLVRGRLRLRGPVVLRARMGSEVTLSRRQR